MPLTFNNFEARLASAIQDSGNVLTQADRDAALRQAIQQRYSKDRPRIMTSDVAGTAKNDISLPADAANPPTAFWEDGFSEIRLIEYPIGQVPASILNNDEWLIYRAPTGQNLRLIDFVPAVTESIRVTWTARHAIDGSSVMPQDFEAVCDYAASLCFAWLAAKYATTRDPVIGADVVNYRTKAQEYTALAKEARKRYFNYMGIAEDAQEDEAGSGPSLVIGDQRNTLGAGVERLTHSKLSR